MVDKRLLLDLSKRISHYLEEDDLTKIIQQDELSDLLTRGVIDHSQAFLIYELFHGKRLETVDFLTLENEYYVFFGKIPVCFTLNVIFSIIALLFFISQTCNMKQEQPSMLF